LPTSSQLFWVANLQVGNVIDLSRHAGWQLAAQVECTKRPGLQQVAN